MLTHDEIVNLTEEYGGEWGIMHAERLLKLISMIDEGIEYDREVVWLAAYLHDWGGYGKWAKPGVEHYDRSVEVISEFLVENGYPQDFNDRVLECIKYHHGGPADRNVESLLFTDADVLDLLGVVGTLKIFSFCPRNLKAAYGAVKKYRDAGMKSIAFDKTREIADKRVHETDELLRLFEEESFGLY